MLDDFFRTLVELGARPNVIVDVGAHRGAWTRTALRHFPDARFVLFEPQRDLIDAQVDLRSPAIRIVHEGVAAVADPHRAFTMHADRASWSFAISPDEAVDLGLEQITAPVTTLDAAFATGACHDLPAPDILNIDAVGTNLEVLAGADRVVAAADIVIVGAGVTNRIFADTAAAVVAEMDRRGFALLDVLDPQRPTGTGALWSASLAFANRSGRTWAAVGTRDKQLGWALEAFGG